MQNILRSLRSKNEFVELLSEGPYLNFSLSVFFSQIAFNMMSVVLIFLIFHLTSSNFSVSIIVLTYLLPQIFFSFLGGVVADLRNKRAILIYGNLLRAGVILLLFFYTKSPFLIYIVSFIISAITQFYIPAETPMIPNLVKKSHLITANSIFGISFFGSILLGYILAGIIINISGYSNVFLLLSLLFLFSGLFAYFIPNNARRKDDDSSLENDIERSVSEVSIDDISRLPVARRIIHNLKECYHFLRQTGKVWSAFFLLAFSQVVIMILASIIPGYAQTILHVKAADLSLLLFAPAALGMVTAGVLLSGVLKHVTKNKLMNTGIFISGISLALFPLSSKIPSIQIFSNLYLNTRTFAIFLAYCAGFSNALIFIPSQTIIQETVPEDFSSKIYGLLFAFIGILSLVPIVLVGTLADIIGVGSVLVGVGIAIIAVGVAKIELISSIIRGRKKGL